MISDFGLFGPKDQKEVCVYVNFEVVLVCFSIKTTIHVSLYFLSHRCCKIIVGMVLELSANGGTCVKIIDMGMDSNQIYEIYFLHMLKERRDL